MDTLVRREERSESGGGLTRRDALGLIALAPAAAATRPARAATVQGQLTWGVHVSLAPVWFDPAEVSCTA